MAKKSIILKCNSGMPAQIERVPGAVFYPGHLIYLASTNKVAKHAVSGGSVAPTMFAVEDAFQGKTLDDAFAITGRAVCWIPQKGDEVYAILADGQTIVIGDKLESNGDGTLTKHAADTGDSDDAVTIYDKQIVAIALEAVDLSTSSGVETANSFDGGYDQRLKVMIV
jgi:hypothetical protein